MSDKYDFGKIEQAWQKKWEDTDIYEVKEDVAKKKRYILEMFPYPSGEAHMGHVRNYSIADVIARFNTMQGFNVLHPIGWDAFGLPAENAAIKHGVQPAKWTENNIAVMKRQLKRLGFSYNWSREVNTSSPDYYRWGQWIFLKFMEKGLVYRKKAPVNWCSSCETVLANEQAKDGTCWRCDSVVEMKDLEQWFFKITDYAQPLLDELANLTGWPERVRIMQENWIGRSEGAMVDFQVKGKVDGKDLKINVFTTRPDTLYGATFFLLSPEHPLVDVLVDESERKGIEDFISEVTSQDKVEREEVGLEKMGHFTGRFMINPLTGKEIPVYLANYILMEYGTGAVMAVPAHDQRDFEFARKYDIPVKVVIQPEGEDLDGKTMLEAYIGEGIMVNSDVFNGMPSQECLKRMPAYLKDNGIGEGSIHYRLRDWLISRQRYWGNPIPVVYCDKCGIIPVPDKDLPVVLPTDVEIDEKGRSPLKDIDSFTKAKCPKCGGDGKRETDTMDTFTCSSWYFLRYCSPKDDQAVFEKDAADYWMSVDQYIGGIEHAVMHLLYARFFTHVFYDMDMVKVKEPFENLLTQGMVIKDGQKMSKSKGNVVDPGDIVDRYGADTARLFILFAAPPELDLEWSDKGVEGVHRFLKRVYRITVSNLDSIATKGDTDDGSTVSNDDKVLRQLTHRSIKKVTDDIKRFNFNTAISATMELVNGIQKYVEKMNDKQSSNALKEAIESLLLLIAPFAPHVAEDLWAKTGNSYSIHSQQWPKYDEKLIKTDEITMIVQVDGKLRDRITAAVDIERDDMAELALASDKVKNHLTDKDVVKTVVVPGRLVNIVTRPK